MRKKKKEMIPPTVEENKSYKKQKYVTYARKDLVLMMIIKSIINSDITVTSQEYIEEPFIVFVIWDLKHEKKFL